MNIRRINLEGRPEIKTGYILPFSYRPISIHQGYNGPYSHFAYRRESHLGGVVYDYRFFIDFIVPPGTPVKPAKEGVVHLVLDDYSDFYEGSDILQGLLVKTNFIVIRHEDGTNTLYSHLAQKSSRVKRNERVQQDQVIALTGLSGWIGPVPHLHFGAIYSLFAGSFPVQFADFTGPLEHEEIGRVQEPLEQRILDHKQQVPLR